MSEQIKRYFMQGSDASYERDNGAWVEYTDHAAALSAREAEIERLRGELDSQYAKLNEAVHVAEEATGRATAAEAQVRGLREAIDNIRDAVLHGRYQLEGYPVDNDITNAVLGIIDDALPALAPAPTAAHGEAIIGREVVSEPGAFIKVERIILSDAAKRGLMTNATGIGPDHLKPSPLDTAARRVAEAADKYEAAKLEVVACMMLGRMDVLSERVSAMHDADSAVARELPAFRAAKNGGGE